MQLEAVNVGFRYRERAWVFRGVNLTLRAGEIVGLVGPSGCGKTTLGKILAGYERATEGEIQLNRSELPTTGYHPVQMVFQHPEKAVNSRWKIERIISEGWKPDDRLLDALGIEKAWFARWPHELSGGELQRCCIARALSPNTQFLIADEMTAMLDAITQAQIWQAMLALAKQRSLGILVISHEWRLLERVCQRIVRWNEGKHGFVEYHG